MTGKTLIAGLFLLAAVVPVHAESGSFSLRDSASATVDHHRGIKTLQENREASLHELRRAQAGYGPSIDVTGRGGTSLINDKVHRGLDKEDYFYETGQVGITLTQPLWDGLATRSRVRSTQATVDSVTHRVVDNATSLGLDGIIAHIDVLRRRKLLELAQENVRRHQEILASSRARQSGGADTMADVTQTEARLARAQSTLAESQAALASAEDSYRRLTGREIPALTDPDHAPVLFDEPQAVLKSALKSNPKIMAYMADVRAAVGDKELAEAAFYPIINLEAGAYTSDRRNDNDESTTSAEVMGTVRWNIFNSGADKAGWDAAQARIRQARQTLMNQWDELKLEVRNTWSNYISAREQYKFYTQAVDYNTRTRDAYMEQFLLGQRSLLDVLDAENELFNSSSQAVTMGNNVLISEYRLEALTGTLISDLKIPVKNLYKAPKTEEVPVMNFN